MGGQQGGRGALPRAPAAGVGSKVTEARSRGQEISQCQVKKETESLQREKHTGHGKAGAREGRVGHQQLQNRSRHEAAEPREGSFRIRSLTPSPPGSCARRQNGDRLAWRPLSGGSPGPSRRGRGEAWAQGTVPTGREVLCPGAVAPEERKAAASCLGPLPRERRLRVKNRLPEQKTAKTRVRPPGREGPLKRQMAARSSILAWTSPRTEEPGGPQSLGSQSRTRLSPCTNTAGQELLPEGGRVHGRTVRHAEGETRHLGSPRALEERASPGRSRDAGCRGTCREGQEVCPG